MKKKPVSAKIVSEYILSLSEPEVGDIISNLKLQKLLYYCQGFHLAIYKKPLFEDRIEHWTYGPVVPNVYHEFKKYGDAHIPIPKGSDFSVLSKDQKELIDDVYDDYGQFSAWKLRDMTHQEPPWNKTKDNEEISHEQLSSYFITCVEDNDNG